MKTYKRGLGKFNDGKDFDEECFGQSNLDGDYKKSQSQRQCCGVYPNRWEIILPVKFIHGEIRNLTKIELFQSYRIFSDDSQ